MSEEYGRDGLSRLPLFEPHKLHRKHDPITSHEAAGSVKKVRETHFCIILAELADGKGSSEQIADRTGLPHPSVWRRMGELRDAGLVMDSGEKSRNRSGRWATVWRLARRPR